MLVLADHLLYFNEALLKFQEKFPTEKWSLEFKHSLINDYSFYSSRIEDSKLQYGDTIRFLNNETISGVNISSLLGVSEHQMVLKNLLENLEDFKLTENLFKNVHASLMRSPLSWDTEFKTELIGNYRNTPAIGFREPFFKNKKYVAHFNLEFVMHSWIEIFNNQLNDLDNSLTEKHLLTRIAFFHNMFLNDLHPFADGNGRVCRIIIGAILMNNNCPPIFHEITSQAQQVEYITTIVECEKQNNNNLLVEYFAKGMTSYLLKKVEID